MIDAVVVAYRSRSVIDRCLDALGRVAELGTIAVVDHGDDGAGAHARTRGAIAFEDPANPGFGAGQNRGRALTDAPFVLMVNPDAEVVASGIAAGLAVLERRPEVAMVQGVVRSHDGSPERSAGRALGPVHLWGRALGLRRLLALPLVRGAARRIPAIADHAERAPATATDVAALACVAVLARRSALEECRGFDADRYFLYGEDMDLCRRLRDAGWTLTALPDLWATHISGGSAASSWDREIEWWRGTMTFAARWWSRPAWWSARGAAMVMSLRLLSRRPRERRRVLEGLLPRRS